MNREWVRHYCLSLPHTTEEVLWKIDLVFKIGGKMFATLVLEPHAVCLESFDAMTRKELEPRLQRAYELIFAKLPKKTQRELRPGN